VSDPTRLLDEPGELSPAERRALEAALGERPPRGAKRAVFGAVLASLPVPAGNGPSGLEGAGGAALAAKALGFAALVKPALVGVALGVATTAGYVGLSSPFEVPDEQTTKSPESAEPVSSPVPPGSARPEEAPERATAPDDRAAAVASSGTAPNARKHEPTPAPPALGDTLGGTTADAPAPSTRAFPEVEGEAPPTSLEGRRVAEARALLRSGRARAALTALTAIGAEFPRGALVQEREALAIEALLMTESRDEARARAEQFLARYPTSPHAAAARRALE
jgi:hypothetical protein